MYRILKFQIGEPSLIYNDNDSEGLDGRYELSDSESDSNVVTGKMRLVVRRTSTT